MVTGKILPYSKLGVTYNANEVPSPPSNSGSPLGYFLAGLLGVAADELLAVRPRLRQWYEQGRSDEYGRLLPEIEQLRRSVSNLNSLVVNKDLKINQLKSEVTLLTKQLSDSQKENSSLRDEAEKLKAEKH